ncbi:hypothetical protein J3R30DRAFT_1446401 [Lentinula aciculospora]|uniref:Uncharacterized protein n=1 Tax=Lentinula aciculospora TaxID=153920 RepID=A0A9W9AM49_9AGAR|nr:hypothetical protein J3R30DRAFT_1446401 [Lentinula aciculospora]
MRRSDPRPISSGTPSIPLFESNATTGLVTFPPSSHTSLNTPTLSRGNTVEPAFVARPQQDENQHYAPQITPTPNFMVPSFMQPGVAIPQSFPINPQSFQQMQIQNQIMFLALANKVMNLAALSQAQPQQPYPNSVFPTHNILASAPAPVSTINAEEHTISNDWPSLNSSRSSSGEPSRDAKGKQKATSPANSFSSVGSISEAQAPIFTRNGESVMFFVQIDLSQRHDLVSKIKVRSVKVIILR